MDIIKQTVTEDSVTTEVQKQVSTTPTGTPMTEEASVVQNSTTDEIASQPTDSGLGEGMPDAGAAGDEVADAGTLAEAQPTVGTPVVRRLVEQSTLDRRLFVAQMLLDNTAANPEILECVSATGYDLATLDKGRARYDEALRLHRSVRVLHGEQKAATQRFHEVWRAARHAHTQDLHIARRILGKNPDAVGALLLHGKRKQSFGTWVGQVGQFYDRLLARPGYLAAVAAAGLTEAVLAESQQLLFAAEAAMLARTNMAVEVTRQRRVRDQSLAELDRWVSTFRAVLRKALRDKPILLKKLWMSEARAVPTAPDAAPASEPENTGGPVFYAS